MWVLKKCTLQSFIYKRKMFIGGLIALAFIPVANAANITLTWNPSPSVAASGYNLYYGKTSKRYTNKVNVGNTTTYTLKGFIPGQKYYIAATAYCRCDRFQESDFSKELEIIIPGVDSPYTSSIVPRTGWRLVHVDSEEVVAEDGHGSNAFDGDPSTFWHTQWGKRESPPPHEIQIDLGAVYRLEGFRYLPRQDGSDNGRIKQYEFYVSNDPSNWGSAVATGALANSAAEQTVRFNTPVTGRYIRLRALSEVSRKPWTSMAELNLTGNRVNQ